MHDGAGTQRAIAPVSYTHLDVYKRQALGLTRARALPEGRLGLGQCVADGDAPLWLFLKPGKLGAEDVLLQAVA